MCASKQTLPLLKFIWIFLPFCLRKANASRSHIDAWHRNRTIVRLEAERAWNGFHSHMNALSWRAWHIVWCTTILFILLLLFSYIRRKALCVSVMDSLARNCPPYPNPLLYSSNRCRHPYGVVGWGTLHMKMKGKMKFYWVPHCRGAVISQWCTSLILSIWTHLNMK